METKNKHYEEVPGRAFQFLRGAATNKDIRAKLASAGYTAEDHKEGSQLLVKVSNASWMGVQENDEDSPNRALEELDQWEEPGFRRVRAALGRLHPEQHAFVFNQLEPVHGKGAVVTVTVLLDRLDALESSPERAATRAADQAALDTLTKRGIDPAERARLRSLTELGLSSPDEAASLPDPTISVEQEKAMEALAAWFGDWSNTARAIIQRRDHLIRLGLLKRRRVNGKEVEETVTPYPSAVASIVTSASAKSDTYATTQSGNYAGAAPRLVANG